MTDHGEAGHFIGTAEAVHDLYKSPVHLIGLARASLITSPTISLGSDKQTFWRNEMLMLPDIIPNYRLAPLIALLMNAVIANGRVFHSGS